jgi:hypothetical protein
MDYQSNALVNSLQPARLANRQQGIGRHFFRWIYWADSLIREAVVACWLAPKRTPRGGPSASRSFGPVMRVSPLSEPTWPSLRPLV